MVNGSTYKHILTVCAAVLMLFLACSQANAQQVGLKTNALFWTLGSPNLGCEVVVGDHSSLDFSAFGHYRPYGLDSKVLAFQPEYRYWFSGRPMTREYIGASVMLAGYDMAMRNYVYDGNALSLGLTGGYAFLLGKKWRFELSGGFGFLIFRQKQYYKTDDSYEGPAVPANSWGYKLFPAKLGISFTYILR